MRNGPRYVPPGSLVEVTARVVGGRFLLAPTPELVARMRGSLGRATTLSSVELHAFAFLSNHWHGLMSVPNARVLSAFLQRLHSTIGVAVHDLVPWSGRVFQKAAFVLVAADREEERLRYVLSQGTKEGLVSSPLEWPGLHSARAMCGEETLVGEWCDRALANRLGARNGVGLKPCVAAQVYTSYPIPLAPLPSWRKLSVGQRQERTRALVLEIEMAAREKHAAFLGVERVVSQDPLQCGEAPKRRRHAPIIHAAEQSARQRALTERSLFQDAHRYAGALLRNGQSAIVPPQCFPPLPPFGAERVNVVLARSAPRDDPGGGTSDTKEEGP